MATNWICKSSLERKIPKQVRPQSNLGGGQISEERSRQVRGDLKLVKHAYRDPKNIRPATRALLGKITAVLDSYQRQGYVLTLRQLFYQLVTQNILENRQKNYGKLSQILGEARMIGAVDWEVIEDRIRVPKFPNEFIDIKDAMETITQVYRRRRWIDQPKYVEVWVEKDALSGVLEPITNEYHVHLLVNRGYSSISAMHDSALRFLSAERKDKECYLLYFGDHDPSGEDMVRDIDHRLAEFGATVDIRKVALTRDQITEYDLPPNPAKMSDPRARGYVDLHGEESWELDALPPNVLVELVRNSLEELLDRGAYDLWLETEEEEKKTMGEFGLEYYDPIYRVCKCTQEYEGVAGDMKHTGKYHNANGTGKCRVSGCKCKEFRFLE